jgi:hypothetical protein
VYRAVLLRNSSLKEPLNFLLRIIYRFRRIVDLIKTGLFQKPVARRRHLALRRPRRRQPGLLHHPVRAEQGYLRRFRPSPAGMLKGLATASSREYLRRETSLFR